MQTKQINNKKAFSLPVAIIVTAVLVLLSGSLIFIAANSLSSTTSDTNGRQAYLNVRSALNYAASYYNQSKDLSKIGTECIIMSKDGNGTKGSTAGISQIKVLSTDPLVDVGDDAVETAVGDNTTYVVAKYNKPDGSNPATLKLTAYSLYSDTFGQRPKMARLSVIYNVGGGGGTLHRVTVPTIDTGSSIIYYDTSQKKIKLNIKQAPNQNWTLAYYVWTYKDNGHIYDSTETCYDFDSKSMSSSKTEAQKREYLKKMNQNEWAGGLGTGKILNPDNKGWVGEGSADKLGPPSIAKSVGNNWYQDEFVYSDDQVNYFNFILAKKGAVLAHGTENTQTCEMFHLWYIDPSDKNIYFEFLKPTTKYNVNTNWNGKDDIEDTVLVYVNNPKTTVHFRLKGVDESNVTPSISAPVISNVKVGGSALSGPSYLNPGTQKENIGSITMQYEGCGWWVANVETNRTFMMDISYGNGSITTSHTISVSPNSDKEAWVAAELRMDGVEKIDKIQVRLSEDNANRSIGADTNNYVTVHVKPSSTTNKVSPALSYLSTGLTSSEGRRKLLEKIMEAHSIPSGDYTAESYAKLTKVLDGDGTNKGAIEIYNDINFINNQIGPSTAEKINQANSKYQDQIENIDKAIKALVSNVCDAETIAELQKLVQTAQKIVDSQNTNHIYDKDAFDIFIAADGNFEKAKTAINKTNVTVAEVNPLIKDLQKDIDDINLKKLNKSALETAISDAESITKAADYNTTKYTEASMLALNNALANAKHENEIETTQVNIDIRTTELINGINGLVLNLPDVDMSALNTAVTKAQSIIDAVERKDCTDDTYSTLNTELAYVKSEIPSISTQARADELTTKLNTAVDTFYVYKPKNTNAQLNSEGKIRVWLSGFEINSSSADGSIISYTVKFSKEGSSDIYSVGDGDVAHDIQSGMSYFDADKSLYDNVSVVVSKSIGEGTSAYIVTYESNVLKFSDVTDNNLVLVLGNTFTEGTQNTCTITASKAVKLYIENNNPYNGTDIPRVTLYNGTADTTGKVLNAPGTGDGLVTSGTGHNYYCVSFVEAPNQKIGINTRSDGTGTLIEPFAVKAGEWVVRYDKTSVKVQPLINVDNVYPKYIAPEAPDPAVTTSKYISEELVAPSIISNITNDYSIVNTKTVTEDVPMNINVASNEKVIFIKAEGTVFESRTPCISAWKENGTSKTYYTGSASKQIGMTRYEDTDCYYIAVKDEAQKIKVTDSSGREYIASGNISGSKYIELKVTGTTTGTDFYSDVPFDQFPTISDNQCMFILNAKNKNEIKNGAKKPAIHTWHRPEGGGAGQDITAWPGSEMTRLSGTDFFYVILSYESSKIPNWMLLTNTEAYKYTAGDYKIPEPNKRYQYLDFQSSGNIAIISFEGQVAIPNLEVKAATGLPTIQVSHEEQETMSVTDIKMPFVGGNKVRITNRSYYETFNSIINNNANCYDGHDHDKYHKRAENGNFILSNNLFGSQGISGKGRVGDASLNTMYDWYEFKIPVDSLNTYTFEVKGVNNSSLGTFTKQLSGIYGNIWLTVNSDATESVTPPTGGARNVYKDIDIYTFNPDETIMEDNITVYFKAPAGSSNIKMYANGVGGNQVKSLSSGGEENYYYCTVSKKTPFVTFTYNIGSDIKEYKTTLQGGDYILFNPESNLGSGAWDIFVPAKEKFRRELVEAQTLYYGHVLVAEYDNSGNVVPKYSGSSISSSTYKYPEGITSTPIYGGHPYSYYMTSGSVNSNIDALDTNACNLAYTNLHEVVTAYKSLYSMMAKARAYIKDPSSGGQYPEYLNRGNKRVYTDESVNKLKAELANSEGVYSSGTVTASSLNAQTKMLKEAISNIEVKSEGTIVVLYKDVQQLFQKGAKIEVKYNTIENDPSTSQKEQMTDRNPEGYPIIFIDETNIFNVKILVNGTERTPEKNMKTDDVFVFMDYESGDGKPGPYWTNNSTSDYKQINSDEFTQRTSGAEYKYTMRTETVGGVTEYVPMTLYFQYDTVINLSDGTSYKIRAGAYYFDKPDDAPVSGGKVNLYSAAAKSYFTNPINYGKYVSDGTAIVQNGEDIGWVNTSSGKLSLKTGNQYTLHTVNFTANDGYFRIGSNNYTSLENMYFRWEGNKDLVVKADVTFAASELTIASSGTIDASSVYGKHFYLMNSKQYDNNGKPIESMVVNFASDVYIKYTDITGDEVSFVIREGSYKISKSDSSNNYIADLFDKDYWTTMEHITILNDSGVDVISGGGTSGGNLSQPIYSTD